MSHLATTLAQSSQRNSELMNILSQTDYAPPALKQNTAYISDLETQIKALDRDLKRLHQVTEDERKEHLKYRDSTVKRFAYKLGGHKGSEKFSTRQEKEEREFLEAWQKEREAKDRREELGIALQNAQNDQQRLEDDTAKHDQAQAEIDRLYESIFTGPTPEVPGEDQMESSVQTSRQWYQQCEAQLRADTRALEGLTRGDKFFLDAVYQMSVAHSNSTWDVWGGGGFADMMERNALSAAQNALMQGLHHVEEAIRTQPAIKRPSHVNIDHGHFVSDILFDNVFSDLQQHDRIKESEGQTHQAHQELRQEIAAQENRCKDGERVLKQARQQLEDARGELQKIRAEAFERLAGGGGYPGAGSGGFEQQGPPPSYSATA